MSKIRGKNTVPEKILGSAMHKAGNRFRKQISIVGKPDFGIKKYKIAVFVDGEFWHGKKWLTQTNNNKIKRDLKRYGSYWVKKISNNIKRDVYVNMELKKLKWKVFRFWDSEVRENPEKCAKIVIKYLRRKKRVIKNKCLL